MTLPNEDNLVQQAQQGDTAALGELLAAYQRRLYNVVLRMVSNRDDAAEVTQEAMLKIIQNVGNYNGQAAISTWMTRIAMNQSISHLRKRRLRQTTSLDTAGGGGGYSSGGGNGRDQMTALRDQIADIQEPGPDQCVQQREMMAHVHNALGRLDDDFQAVLVLRDINEMDYQEIAQTLAIPVGTVKSRLFRARLALRQEMFKLYPPTGQAATGQASPGQGPAGRFAGDDGARSARTREGVADA